VITDNLNCSLEISTASHPLANILNIASKNRQSHLLLSYYYRFTPLCQHLNIATVSNLIYFLDISTASHPSAKILNIASEYIK